VEDVASQSAPTVYGTPRTDVLDRVFAGAPGRLGDDLDLDVAG
jgi:hypothetical protein